MTTYAPNWTPRYKAGYKVGGINHTLTLRAPRGTDVAGVTALATVAHDVFNAMAAQLMDDFTWTDASYALTDSDVFVPTAPPAAVTGAISTAAQAIKDRISPLTLTGRSASGRARVSLYGISLGVGAGSFAATDFIVTEAEYPAMGDAIDVLQAGAVGNAGEVTTWHRTGTVKPNDRLVKLVRRGIVS